MVGGFDGGVLTVLIAVSVEWNSIAFVPIHVFVQLVLSLFKKILVFVGARELVNTYFYNL